MLFKKVARFPDGHDGHVIPPCWFYKDLVAHSSWIAASFCREFGEQLGAVGAEGRHEVDVGDHVDPLGLRQHWHRQREDEEKPSHGYFFGNAKT